MLLCVLPNQLFDKKYLPKEVTKVVLWEHPDFFTKYNFNKKKLLLHRASMRWYYNYLKSHYQSVHYITFNQSFPFKNYLFFDPINTIQGFTNDSNMIESPNFFLNKDEYDIIYKNKKSKKISFTRYFYPRCKQKFDFLTNVASTDKNNRNAFDTKLSFVKQPSFKSNKYVSKAKVYVNRYFKDNLGDTDNFNFPINFQQTRTWFKHFVEHNLKNFGSYQDAFNTDHDNLFHSILSSSMNIGLIHPNEIIEELRNVSKSVPLNSLEAFVRQLCWREFQRYCYIYYSNLANLNFFNLHKKLSTDWYHGTTKILPVDNCIRKAFDTAYLHHIERLMIMGNFMVLSEISPQESHRWFMEFAIDSYEWVMLQNVYDMVYHNGNGLTSYKPYITSNQYLLKMSNYSSTEKWNNTWLAMYKAFLKNHTKQLRKYSYHFRID